MEESESLGLHFGIFAAVFVVQYQERKSWICRSRNRRKKPRMTGAIKIFRKHALAAVIFSGVVIGNPGCRIPELCRPDQGKPLPETFNGQVNWENSACVELHEFFNDPLLTGLVDQALVDNQELKILAQDIRIANNEVLARRGAYFPFVFFGARAGAEKSGEFTREGAVESNLMASGKSFPDPLLDFLTHE